MKEIITDIAVMGSGLGGMTAAFEIAKKSDVKVAVFEKRPFQGGAVSNCPMMFVAVPEDDESQDKALAVHSEFVNYNADLGLARTWFKYSSRIPGFITKELGQEFIQELKFPPETYGKMRGYTIGFPNGMHVGDYYLLKARGKGHGAAVILLRMRQILEKMGIEFHFSTPIKQIIKEDGKVTGAIAKTKDGKDIKIHCKALIVASGGFSDNPEMIKEELGYHYTNFNCDNGGNVVFIHYPNGGFTGDGQKAVWAIGGDKGGMDIAGTHLIPGPGIDGNTKWITKNQIRTVQEQPYLWVNQLGERYANEEISNNHMAMCSAIANQPERCAYLIFDADTEKLLGERGPEDDYVYFIFKSKGIINLEGQMAAMIAAGNKHTFIANNLKELSEKTGIDLEGLKRTLKTYNSSCEKGHDDEFGKNKKYLYPVREDSGKLYAFRIYPGGYSTLGGVRVNSRCEVLDTKRLPIKGLYAIGDIVSGSVFGDPPACGCGTMSQAMALGFAAADYSCEYVRGV